MITRPYIVRPDLPSTVRTCKECHKLIHRNGLEVCFGDPFYTSAIMHKSCLNKHVQSIESTFRSALTDIEAFNKKVKLRKAHKKAMKQLSILKDGK